MWRGSAPSAAGTTLHLKGMHMCLGTSQDTKTKVDSQIVGCKFLRYERVQLSPLRKEIESIQPKLFFLFAYVFSYQSTSFFLLDALV